MSTASYPQRLEPWRAAALQALEELKDVTRQGLRQKEAERHRIEELEPSLRCKENA